MFYAEPTSRVIFTTNTSLVVFSLGREQVWKSSVFGDFIYEGVIVGQQGIITICCGPLRAMAMCRMVKRLIHKRVILQKLLLQLPIIGKFEGFEKVPLILLDSFGAIFNEISR